MGVAWGGGGSLVLDHNECRSGVGGVKGDGVEGRGEGEGEGRAAPGHTTYHIPHYHIPLTT